MQLKGEPGFFDQRIGQTIIGRHHRDDRHGRQPRPKRLRKVVAKNPMLAGEAAVAFYDFGDVVAARGLAQAFRSGLAAVSVVSVMSVMSADDRLADALVDEARLAFELHRQLFEELAS